MQITSYGAAGGVTGSKHLLEAAGRRILLDCGTFQGLPDVRARNKSLPFPPESIDMVILSHAHLDHCGMLPLLVKRGYMGKIYTTPATRNVAEQMLLDAAGIEAQDAQYRQKHHIGSPDDREPLFTKEDVAAVMARIETVPYERVNSGGLVIDDKVTIKFYDAGHILGSAVTVLEIKEEDTVKRVAYTGDLGPRNMPLLPDPEVPKEAISALLMESTYGAGIHDPLQKAIDRLTNTIIETYNNKGKMIVPAFALGRTQMFVYVIHKLIDEGKIPRFPIYVDSPLASRVTSIYKSHTENYDKESEKDFEGGDHLPLAFRNLTYVNSVQESKNLNLMPGPMMIIASSGMMTGGRVVHHLRHNIRNSRNAIFITGYQAEGTLGRALLEGVKKVELYGDWFPVKAKIHLFNEFSAHADSVQLREYAESIQGLKGILLVHGEPSQADVLMESLHKAHPDWNVDRPKEGESVELG